MHFLLAHLRTGLKYQYISIRFLIIARQWRFFCKKTLFCIWNWLPWQRPLSDRQMNAGFIKPLHRCINRENLVKIRPVVFENSWLRGRLQKNKKHLKNVGPIRHCEPPHAACSNFTLPFTRCRYCRHHYQDEPKPAIAIAQAAWPRATVATPGEWQCKIDVHNKNDNNNNAWQRGQRKILAKLWPPDMHARRAKLW